MFFNIVTGFFHPGNLPTERITKRDLFHVFHKYGKLAQASIKQAYGFIQFLDPSACKKALGAEQGALVRGRKIRKCSPVAGRWSVIRDFSHPIDNSLFTRP